MQPTTCESESSNNHINLLSKLSCGHTPAVDNNVCIAVRPCHH